MNDSDKSKAMAEAAKQLMDIIQQRMNNRIEIIDSIRTVTTSDVPNQVKTLREIELQKNQEVLSEQKDLINLIKVLFPNVKD